VRYAGDLDEQGTGVGRSREEGEQGDDQEDGHGSGITRIVAE
jgi:hypothetical protein